MKTAKVSLVKGDDRKKNIVHALDAIKSELGKLKNAKKILIKPNLNGYSKEFETANTHVDAIRAILEFLKSHLNDFEKKEVVIAEGSGDAFYKGVTTRRVFKQFGYFELEKEYPNVKLFCVDEETNFYEVPVVSCGQIVQMKLSKIMKECDYVISAAVPKTHNVTIATGGIKNMMGMIKSEDKFLIHGIGQRGTIIKIYEKLPIPLRKIARGFYKLITDKGDDYKFRESIKQINKNIVLLAKAVMPDLVVLDGFVCMEGNGPLEGTPVNLKVAIASTDAVKADYIAFKTMGINPLSVGYIYYLNQEGIGDCSENGLVGEKVEDVAKKFKMHSTYEIQKCWK
jgi:uncharacterized protein (DUF362 family)